MAEEFERYRAKVTFRHKFENAKDIFDKDNDMYSPNFFARNLAFQLALFSADTDICSICCDLFYPEDIEEGRSLNVEFQLSLISPPKTIHSGEMSCIFQHDSYFHKVCLSEIFPGEELIVDDALTLEVSLWVDEPEGISDYNPPKEKLRKELQILENQEQSDAFVSLLDSGEFSDVTFVVNGDSSRVKAHKTILAARSNVFARMLSTDMLEAKKSEIKIDDMGAPALKIMLRYIYSGQLKFPKGLKIDLKICQELVNAGEKYNLQNLKEYSAMAMTEFASLENAWELLSFATRFQAKAATKELSMYYGANVYEIMKKV